MSANRSSSVCNVLIVLLTTAIAHVASHTASAQNWPQWLGPNRDAKITGFKAPAVWPKELKQKWKVEIGDGVATPALVDDKLFVFSRQANNEIVRCLNAATGDELWQDKYESLPIMGSAAGFQGPRSSPTVADGKLITLGTRGILSCYDFAGKLLWRKNDFPGTNPRFYFSSSPLVADGVCLAQLGGNSAALVAYKLNDGAEAWRWTGDGSAYSSPVMMSVDGMTVVVAVT
ncbi:MAG TPA: PQQ-binding-like beta-propeller repeat protein, partial [Pirellulales bacterium]